MSGWRITLWLLLWLSTVLPGQRMAWTHVHLPGSGHVAMYACLPLGEEHDPGGQHGLAHVVGNCVVLHQEQIGEAAALHVEVHPRMTMFWQLVRTAELSKATERLTRYLSAEGGLLVDADLLALAKARTRLQVDDAARLFPGRVLRVRARQASGRRGLVGSVKEIAGLTRAAVQRRLQLYGASVSGACLVTLGDVRRKDLPQALVDWHSAQSALAREESPRRARVVAVEASAVTVHRRIDGPFVSNFVAAPACVDADWPAFMVASLVLRNASAVHFGGYRGGEWRADFPHVRYRPLDGDGLLLINRRGPNDSVPEVAQREISALLDRLARNGVQLRQVEQAAQELRYSLACPAPGSQVKAPGSLLVKGRVLAVRHCLKWPVNLQQQVSKVSQADVQRILVERFNKKRRGVRSLRVDPNRPRRSGDFPIDK